MNEGKKVLMIVMDGMADRACSELRGMSPLQFVRTPNLDWYVEHGISGLSDPVAPGIRCSTHQAYLSMLGYDARNIVGGSGSFDALGLEMDMQPGDIAMRCYFETIDDSGHVLHPTAGNIASPDTVELVEALDGMEIDGIECHLKAGLYHRAVLILKGDDLSPDISEAYNPDGTVGEVRPLSSDAWFTADVVNRFQAESREILARHVVNRRRKNAGLMQANALVPSGASPFPDLQPFEEKYGVSGCCVAGYNLVKGLCKAAGMDVYPMPSACNGRIDTDFEQKMRCALEALEDYDFVLLGYKAPDIAGHRKDPRAKVEIVKELDRTIGHMRATIGDNVLVAITCSQCTPCELGLHTGDPVPVAVFIKNCIRDDSHEFSENGCSHGNMGRIRGGEFINICMDMADRASSPGSRIRGHRHSQFAAHGHRYCPLAGAACFHRFPPYRHLLASERRLEPVGPGMEHRIREPLHVIHGGTLSCGHGISY